MTTRGARIDARTLAFINALLRGCVTVRQRRRRGRRGLISSSPKQRRATLDPPTLPPLPTYSPSLATTDPRQHTTPNPGHSFVPAHGSWNRNDSDYCWEACSTNRWMSQEQLTRTYKHRKNPKWKRNEEQLREVGTEKQIKKKLE